eukprot:g399.t1
MEETVDEAEIRCRFRTTYSKYQIVTDPISIPLRLTRHGLSEVVNHLLGRTRHVTGTASGSTSGYESEDDVYIPFDFLYEAEESEPQVNGDNDADLLMEDSMTGQKHWHFLIFSLSRTLDCHPSLSPESILEIKYFPALPPPQAPPTGIRHLPDWVSALHTNLTVNGTHLVLSGCYDGALRVHELTRLTQDTADAKDENMETQEEQVTTLTSAKGIRTHLAGIKSISACIDLATSNNSASTASSSDFVICTASMDNDVHVIGLTAAAKEKNTTTPKTDDNGPTGKRSLNLSLKTIGSFRDHRGGVEAVSIGPSRKLCLSAGWDGLVHLWKLPSHDDNGGRREEEEDSGEGEGTPQKKRAKLDPAQKSIRASLTFKGHREALTCVQWASTTSFFSAGYDHSIMAWDATSGRRLHSMNGNRVITSMDYSLEQRLVATGHTDSAVRLWDPRSGTESVLKRTLKAHTHGWVSDVKWCPPESHQDAKTDKGMVLDKEGDTTHRSNFTILSAGYDGTVRLWDIRSIKPFYTLKAPPATRTQKKSQTQSKKDLNANSDPEMRPRLLCADWAMGSKCVVYGGDNKNVQVASLQWPTGGRGI